MGYTQKCFIRKNTPELREKVYRLGTTRGISIFDDIMGILCANENDIRCWDDEWGNADKLISKGYIDCGTNEELFLAIAAMRDDSDYMQWMTDGTGWCRSELHNWLGLTPKYCYESEEDEDFYKYFYKATVEELVQRFKK